MVAGLLGVLGLAWAGLYVAAGPGIAQGTTVLGVRIGGQSKAGAADTLRRALADEARRPIAVRAAEVTTSVSPAAAGLGLDVPATLEAATARTWNPLQLLRTVGGGAAVDPVVSLDRPRLRAAVAALARQVDREPVEGTVRVDATGRAREVAPVDGRRLDRAGAADTLAAAYLGRRHLAGRPEDLPVTVVDPLVSRSEVDRVLAQVAVPATASPLTVVVDGARAVLGPRDIAAALTFDSDGQGSLRPVLDGQSLHRAVAEQLESVEVPPRDATFRIRQGRPVVVPAAAGREVAPETLAAAVLPLLTLTGDARTARVPLEVTQPKVTTAMAKRLGVVEQVATFTTYYPSDFPPRLQNIHRAANLMDNTLLLPGEVFSLNRAVGERTAARGFAAGFIISGGQLEVDYGGGVSQLATTTFNAAFFAGLQIVEQHPHSFYISRYPEGREATVFWGSKDLRFRNDSENGIFITTSYTNSSVTVSMYGTRRYRIESVKGPRYDVAPYRVVYDPRPPGVTPGSCVATSGVPGFKVVVTRVFYQGGTRVKSEAFRTTYAPENEVRCGSSGPPPTRRR